MDGVPPGYEENPVNWIFFENSFKLPNFSTYPDLKF
jgi:hypothetical protein